MASTISSTSHAILLQSAQTSVPQGGKSYSKSFYTFIHYEHSSYPPRYIILFFVIIFATLALGWFLAGVVRLRQTASYLESCANSKVHCRSNTNLICSLQSSICLCPENQFWNGFTQRCQSMKTKDESCTDHFQCDAQKGLICDTTSRTCQCPLNTYYTITGCRTYGSFGSRCNSSIVPPCNTNLGLVCDPLMESCQCSPSTYWNRARCQPTETYGGYCDQNITCNTLLGLFCRLPGPYPPCDCPSPSKLYTCDCSQGNAWVSSAGPNGTGMCMPQNPYMDTCVTDSQCPGSLGLRCINGTCDCEIPLKFWSWTLGQCVTCESQGYTLIRYQSQYVCTQLINSNLLSYSASKTACLSIGSSLISPIVATDVTVIAKTYPTYRLWMNMETSLNSATYTNNVFPSNQSNWNSYVTNGMNSMYSSYIYALQVIGSYSQTMMFEGNTDVDLGHVLCAYY